MDLEPEAEEREIPRHERERFHTDSGRVVLGGGGITPDVEIEQEFLSDFEVAVERDYALFAFAVDYANAHGEIDETFRVSDALFKEFKTYLRGREKLPEYLEVFNLALSDSLMDANADFLKWGVRRELVRRTRGSQAAYRVAIEKDNQLKEAVELFDHGPGLPALFKYAEAWNREQLEKAAADSAAAANEATAEVKARH
jgi:carboxyl-terminal processing protease